MIHLDTSALVRALTGDRSEAPALRRFVADGNRLGVCSVVLYEWWRGPRTPQDLALQEALIPSDAAVGFGAREAALAARLYGAVSRPRGREIDLVVAACAIAGGATLWTLNPRDFKDIPGLTLA